MSLIFFNNSVHAQIADPAVAINKAGRQRMLSQRMAKCYFQIGMGGSRPSIRKNLDASLATFERQLNELKAYAPTPEIKEIYQQLELKWGPYKELLSVKTPNLGAARQVLVLSDEVLALAHQGTVALEKECRRRACQAGQYFRSAAHVVATDREVSTGAGMAGG
ncbi:type IV pili methyl-accepting chemotaxis transducer N-terminal domain-containing protein [Undibacterium arcticum]